MGYVVLEKLFFEFYAGLGTIQVITWSNKTNRALTRVCVSFSNDSLITTCGDLDRCDVSECDGKEPEKPVVPEDFGPKRPTLSSRIIMNINSPISQ
jgi:hypothetical protein